MSRFLLIVAVVAFVLYMLFGFGVIGFDHADGVLGLGLAAFAGSFLA